MHLVTFCAGVFVALPQHTPLHFALGGLEVELEATRSSGSNLILRMRQPNLNCKSLVAAVNAGLHERSLHEHHAAHAERLAVVDEIGTYTLHDCGRYARGLGWQL